MSIVCTTLVECLRSRASESGITSGYVYLDAGGNEVGLGWGELDRRARSLAVRLRRLADPGSRALVMYPVGIEYVVALFGCWYAGLVAVPAYPPRGNGRDARVESLLVDSGVSVVLVSDRHATASGEWIRGGEAKACPEVLVGTSGDDESVAWRPPPLDEDSAVLIQYTSGSTSTPKGVVLTNRQLLANQAMIQSAFRLGPGETIVSWLPPFHDMGLIGGILHPLYVGLRCVFLSPATFLRTPISWLTAIARYRAVASGGPNFAYEHCVRRIGADRIASLDLSCWEVAFNGAEAVRGETLERFSLAFERAGFRREAFFPCYGLAEACLFVAGGPRFGGWRSHSPASAVVGAGPERRFPGSGQPASDLEVAIVDPHSLEACAPGCIGEIWVKGGSVGNGYWGRTAESDAVFRAVRRDTCQGPYLRTGDLGFRAGLDLVVVGRLKEVIIVRGKNHYPQDLEQSAGTAHPALGPDAAAAFSVEVENEERVVLLCEVGREWVRKPLEAAIAAVQQAIAGEHGVQVWEVVLLPPRRLPRTSSGKIRRDECRRGYREGTLQALARGGAGGVPRSLDEAPAEPRVEAGDRSHADLVGDLTARLARRAQVPVESVQPGRPLGALGLDSLALVSLLHELEEDYGLELPGGVVLEDSTLESLAAIIGGCTRDRRTRPSGGSGSRTKSEALSAGERSLWMLEQSSRGSGACNVGFAARVKSTADPSALARAWARVVDRHGALRTVYPEAGGVPSRRVLPPGQFAMTRVDARGWKPSVLDETIVAELRRPFDLRDGPICRARLFTIGEFEHVLVVAAHHVAVDFWSLEIVLGQFRVFAEAEAGIRSEAPVPPGPDYSDFVDWQRERVEGQDGGALWKYWERQLCGELPILELSAVRARPAVQTWHGAAIRFELDPRLATRVLEVSRVRGVTRFQVLLAGFAVLLERCSGRQDLIVGTVASGRTQARFRETVGYCANMVPLRLDLGGNPSFEGLLDRVHRVVVEAMEHADLPFSSIVERFGGVRDPSRPPLVQAVCTFQTDGRFPGATALVTGCGADPIPFGDFALSPFPTPIHAAAFDLALSFAPAGGTLAGVLEFNTGLLGREDAERLVSAYLCLLEQALREPAIALSCLRLSQEPVAGSGELAPAQAWEDSDVLDVVERSAQHRPEAVALRDGARVICYRELAGLSSAGAVRLRDLGVGGESLVAVLTERPSSAVVAFLAAWKAGGAFLPLDPALPAARLAWVLADARPRVVVVGKGLVDRVRDSALPLWVVDEAEEGELSWERIEAPRSPRSLAYVIYTSGSSGEPKGVGIEHAALANHVAAMTSIYELGPDDRVLQFASLGFDVALEEILPTLAAGGEVVFRPKELFASPTAFWDWCEQERISVLNLPVAWWEELLTGLEGVPGPGIGGPAIPLAEQVPASLRLMVIGGESPRRESVDAWRRAVGTRVPLINAYGPTEATITATCSVLSGPKQESSGVRIGTAVSGVQAWVLDRALQPLPAGIPGELWIGGRGLARGYASLPGATAERFLPDPFSRVPGARMYRTGDRVVLREDGGMEFLGRADRQLKLRGYRIEPEEVEAMLRTLPGVRDAVVVASAEGSAGRNRLVAHVIPSGPERPSGALLRSRAGKLLPAPMVPSLFVITERFPLSAGGKVDRRRLAMSPLPGGEARRAPRGWIEEEIAAFWAVLFERGEVSAEDDFFELGGDSLLATRLLEWIRQMCGLRLELRTVFEEPTLSGLARRIGEASAVTEAPPIMSMSSGAERPVSLAQERLLVLARLEPTHSSYHLPGVLRLSGRLDVEALRWSVEELVRRHESLRSVFRTEGGGARVEVKEAGRWEWEVEDLRGMEAEAREARRREVRRGEARTPFDLERGPLIRARLVRVGEEEHEMLVTVHHLVADGWSIGVMVRELGELYGAGVRGERSPLEGLRVQYGDYAAWQREWLSAERLKEPLGWWRERLMGAEVAELPTDRKRGAVRRGQGATWVMELEAGLVRGLDAVGRGRGATRFMVLASALQVWVGRHTGSRDVSIGTVVANRGRRELEGLVGFFANTVVMRVRWESGARYSEVLAAAREMGLEGYRRQEVPFEAVVEAVQPERDLSRTPLFQVMLVLQNTPEERVKMAGLEVELEEEETGGAKFDVLISAQEKKGRLELRWEYDTDLFEAETVRRWGEQYVRVLEGIVADPEVKVSRLGMMSEGERERVLGYGRGKDLERRGPEGLPGWLEREARERGEAVALETWEGKLVYGELNRRANRLARYLRRKGVRRGDAVGLWLGREAELVVAMWGVMKAGGAYVPLEPAWPGERVSYMLEQSGAQWVVSRRSVGKGWRREGERVVWMDEEAEAIGQEEGTDLGIGMGGEDLAYIIYTSGSTGRPKGVGIRHGGATWLVEWMREAYGKEDRDGVWAATSVSFDLSVYEILGTQALGGRVVLGRDAMEMAERGCAGVVRVVNTVPSAMGALVESGRLEGTVRVVNLAGEALPGRLVKRLYEQGGVERVVNLYGPTEDTTYSTWGEMGRKGEEVTIGKPVANTRAYVVDEAGELVGEGMVGELYLGGEKLARGYVGEADRTAERFVPDGWSGEAGRRVYRTGDLVRWRRDGELEYVGRRDQQVKVRGHRIELGEIEEVLRRQEGVKEAAVMAPERGGERRLVAYVSGGLGREEVEKRLRLELPGYMVPEVVVMEGLPRTANGKVDRRRLPEWRGGEDGVEYEAPEGPVEEALAGLWQELLGVARVGRRDDFFRLGGHSLLAMRFIERVRRVLGVSLELRAVFETPRLLDLATRVRGRQEANSGEETDPPIPRRAGGGDAPTAFSQQRLWVLHQLEENKAQYHLAARLRLSGRLDVEALRWSVEELVRRHESLRSVFRTEGGGARVEVKEAGRWEWEVEDLTGMEAEAREARRREVRRREARTPFDLERGPLIRARLVRVGEEEHELLVTVHHLVADGWSIGVMVRELGELYGAGVRGERSPLEGLSVQYGDYAAWQREWLSAERLKEPLGWWRERLMGAEVAELPTDRKRGAVRRGQGATWVMELEAGLVRGLDAVGRGRGATRFMVLASALQVWVGRHTGSRDVSIGTVVANRGRRELEGLVGFFANTVVMRVRWEREARYSEVLAAAREMGLEGYRRQEVPFEAVVEAVQPERDLSRTPLFQVMLVLQNTPEERVKMAGLEVELEEEETGGAKFDVLISAQEKKGRLELRWEYDTDLFEAGTVRRWGEQYVRLLEGIVADPEAKVSRLGMMSEGERERVLGYGRGMELERRGPEGLPGWLEREARERGEAVALETWEGKLVYGELNRRANRLARYLRRKGVRRGEAVGLWLGREAELVVAMWGVMKAGGAYVPLEPAWPGERVSYMLEQSGARWVVSRRSVGKAWSGDGERVVWMDEEAEAIGQEEGTDLGIGIGGEDLAYIIYTSGSTGRPKGVGIRHGGATWLVEWMREAYGKEDRDGVWAATSVSFDLSVYEILGTQALGGRVVLGRDAMEMAERGCAGVVRVVNTVPSAMGALVESGRLEGTVRVVNLAGEALPGRLVKRLYEQGGVERVVNLYGPTEDTTYSTWGEMGRKGDEVTIGRPVANTRAYVVDEAGELVGEGMVGELYLGGEKLARGYVGEADRTAERFVPDGWSGEAGRRVYRTGDLVRWRRDGELEYVGRRDQQVKVRGHRIELGEIEEVLRRQEGVKEAAVMAPERGGERRLVAYVSGGLGREEVEKRLRLELPGYMVPEVVVMEGLPRTANGKVDRRRLPEWRGGEEGVEYEAPEGPVEEALAGLWQELLGVARVGRRDDFFRLGGHSLLATRLMARIRAMFFAEVPFPLVFQHSDLRAMAKAIEDLHREAPAPDLEAMLAEIESTGGATAPGWNKPSTVSIETTR